MHQGNANQSFHGRVQQDQEETMSSDEDPDHVLKDEIYQDDLENENLLNDKTDRRKVKLLQSKRNSITSLRQMVSSLGTLNSKDPDMPLIPSVDQESSFAPREIDDNTRRDSEGYPRRQLRRQSSSHLVSVHSVGQDSARLSAHPYLVSGKYKNKRGFLRNLKSMSKKKLATSAKNLMKSKRSIFNSDDSSVCSSSSSESGIGGMSNSLLNGILAQPPSRKRNILRKKEEKVKNENSWSTQISPEEVMTPMNRKDSFGHKFSKKQKIIIGAAFTFFLILGISVGAAKNKSVHDSDRVSIDNNNSTFRLDESLNSTNNLDGHHKVREHSGNESIPISNEVIKPTVKPSSILSASPSSTTTFSQSNIASQSPSFAIANKATSVTNSSNSSNAQSRLEVNMTAKENLHLPVVNLSNKTSTLVSTSPSLISSIYPSYQQSQHPSLVPSIFLSIQPSIREPSLFPSLPPSNSPSIKPLPKWTQKGSNLFGSQEFEHLGEKISLSSISKNLTDIKGTTEVIQTRIVVSTALNEYEFDSSNNHFEDPSRISSERDRNQKTKSLYGGIVHVYEFKENPQSSNPTLWKRLGDPFLGEENLGLGASIALSGDGGTLALVSKGRPEFSLKAFTAIYRYVDNEEKWKEIGIIEAGDLSSVSSVSCNLSFDGNRILNGLASLTSNGAEIISFGMYDFKGNGKWTRIGNALLFDSSRNSSNIRNRSRTSDQNIILSSDISSNGDRFIIGVFGIDYTFVQMFEYESITNKWNALMSPIPSRPTDITLSGDGQVFAIGIPTATSVAGNVRVYLVKSKGVWFQLGGTLTATLNKDLSYLKSRCVSYSDYFGFSISLSTSGFKIAIGSPGKCDTLVYDESNGGLRGEVYLYDFIREENEWKLSSDESSNLEARANIFEGSGEGDQYGYSVALSGHGDTLAVSAFASDANGSDSGEVRAFRYE